MKTISALVLVLGVLGLTACGSNEDAAPAPAEQQAATEQQPGVPEDNVFHDQVEALNKAKEAEKLQEQRQQELDKAIEEQTGDSSNDPPHA